jgi:hypothetical protein
MAVLRLLFVLFALLLLLADGLTARHGAGFPHPTAGVMLGLLLGEAGLVATWSACSRRHWVLRLAVAWLTMALLAWPAAYYTGPSWRQWTGLLLLFGAGVALGWKLVYATGWSWHLPETQAATDQSALRPLQFSMANMLEWTTTLALTLGVGSWLALPDRQPFLAALSILALAALTPLWMAILLAETKSIWSRCALASLPLLGSAGVIALNLIGGQAGLLALVVGTQSLVTIFAALLLAIGGGRLLATTASRAPDGLPSPRHPRVVAP